MAAVLVGDNPVRRWRGKRPVAFAALCGLAAAGAAALSHGATYGAGYAQARALLYGHFGSGFAFGFCVQSPACIGTGTFVVFAQKRRR